MRLYVLRTLLLKELLRLLNNRGGLAMAAVMVATALLASAFGQGTFEIKGAASRSRCVVDHWKDDGWVAHLKANVPKRLEGRVSFRSLSRYRGKVTYPPGTVGIQIRPPSQTSTETQAIDGSSGSFKVWVWHPERDGASAAPFETWFWRESRRYFEKAVGLPSPELPLSMGPRGATTDDARLWSELHHRFREHLRNRLERSGDPRAIAKVPEVFVERSRLAGRSFDVRAGIAMFLVLMALCFVCIFLMPSATAEERERGTLLAQALSPASSLEILGAKLVFYPTLAVALAALVAGISKYDALGRPFFWLSLFVTALGTVGIGLTLSVLARTQRSASMAALSYMLVAGLVLMVSKANHMRFPAALMIENHGPMMLLAALNDSVQPSHWGQLGITWVLAVVWCGLATALFRHFGWQ